MLNLRSSVGVRPELKYSLKRARIVDKYTLNDDQLTHPDQIPDYIFNKLMIVDYHVREFKLSNKANKTYESNDSEDEDESVDAEEAGVHPMDAFLGIFHSSDNLLRPYLATKLSACQLSVPFLLPDPGAPSENVTMLLSALENITKSWKSGSSKNGSVQEVFVTKHPFAVVSFVRLGQPFVSKSSWINKIMSDGDRNHDFFFHQDMKGGSVERKIVDGLVELSWYLPGRKQGQTLQQEICFANLRGDARSFEKQLYILLKMSSLLCIVLSSECPDQTVQDILKKSADNDLKVILLFERKLKKDVKESFDKLKSNSDGKFSLIEKSGNGHDFVETVRKQIKKRIAKVNPRPLVELSSYADEFGILIERDEVDSGFKAMIENLLEKGIGKMANLLTLQKHIPVSAKLEREMHRPKRHGNEYEIYLKIAKNEDAQKVSLDHLDKQILNCLNKIANMDELERHKALNMMKHHLGRREKSKSSLGLEHIIRELAQLYQIKKRHNNNAGVAEVIEYDYAGAAADILLSGQPLELVDGDSFYIPLRWFNAVYTKLKDKTNDAKIFVVSVVGIQSSGKSTMLNTMFGLEFPVSAGRCTNGVFASLIPVSDYLKSASKFDYFLVVDTEGLRGSSDPQIRERDNELVTFVIGLADVTIVNIMGENSNEMKEFLEISVHAFLKMKLVEEYNKMSCKIVHQNVGAADAEEKLAGNRSKFIQDLDEITERYTTYKNCKGKYKKFSDIISFDGKEDVFYLPTFQLGNPPMALVNPEYGRGVQTIKNGIISQMCSKKSSHHAVSDFQKRVTDLWEALLQEHFIFSLRNTIELRARRSLEKEYLEKSVSLMVTGMAELEAEIDIALRRCSTLLQRDAEWAEGRRAIKDKAEELEGKMEEAMDAFFETNEDKATLDKWRREISEEIRREKENRVKMVESNCSKTLLYLQRLQDIKEKQITYEEKVMEKAKAFINSFHDSEDKENLKRIFEEEWQRWIADVPQSQERKIDILEEMVNVLTDKGVAVSKDELKEHIETLNTPCIGVNDFTYHTGFFAWLFFRTKKIEQECLESAKTTAKKAIKEVFEFAENESESGLQFTCRYLKKMYDIVVTTIENETKKYVDYSLKLKDTLKCDILLCSFSYSYKWFDKMQERFLQERDIRGNLERKVRPILEIYFENVSDPNKQLLCAASLFVEVLVQQIKSTLDRNMGFVVAGKISQNCEFQNKDKFHARVLIKLGEEGNFESYIPYFEDPVEFLKMELKKRIEDHCLNEIKVDIVSLFENEINKIKHNVLAAIDFADEKTATGEKKLSFWIQQFVQKCSALAVKKEMFVVGAIEDLKEIKVFQKKVRDNLHERVNSLIQDKVNFATFRKWKPSPHEFIFDEMFACQCLCPFCKVLCDESAGHKTHSTQSHRPMGIIGTRHENTGELSHDICTVCVAGDMTFKNLDTLGATLYYRDYRSVNEYYDSWVITGNTSPKQSLYWKWFMAKFRKELARENEATPEKRHFFFWNFITFDMVKERLMLEYDL